MTTIHWNSRSVWGRMPPRAVQMWAIYAAMVNNEGMAWPSLTLLTRLLGTRKRNVAADTRRWLIDHGALEVVEGYVPPARRGDPEAKPAAYEAPMYVRLTGRVVIDGEICSLAYFPGLERSPDEDETQLPNGDPPGNQMVTTPDNRLVTTPSNQTVTRSYSQYNVVPDNVIPEEQKNTTSTAPARARESEFSSTPQAPPAVIAAWESVGGRRAQHITAFLAGAVTEYGEPFVLAAIREGGESSATGVSVKYLRSILEACRKEGRFPGVRAHPAGSSPPAAGRALSASDLKELRRQREETS